MFAESPVSRSFLLAWIACIVAVQFVTADASASASATSASASASASDGDSDIAELNDYSEHIGFDVFTKSGNQTLKLADLAEGLRELKDCDTSGKLAFVVPGWMDDGDESWVLELVHKYLQVRGGTVVVMKYGYYAIDLNYFEVIGEFDGIADILVRAMRIFFASGFCAERTYIFGFSLGARIAMYAASRIKAAKPFEKIDCCDPAGFGFDGHPEHTHFKIIGLARRVNCVHTSSFFGTRERRCDCDWLLGECGKKQCASVGGIADSHKLCTQFWISAFDHPFKAVQGDEAKCGVDRRAVAKLSSAQHEEGYYLGYNEDASYPRGNYYVETFKFAPYHNVSCQHPRAGASASVNMEW